MVDDPIPDAGQPDTSDSLQPQRRGRRSGRGRRGRGRRRKQLQKPESPGPADAESAVPEQAAPLGSEELEAEPPFEFTGEPGEPESVETHPSAEATLDSEREPVAHQDPRPPPQRDFRPAPKASIQRSIQQVSDIVDTLRESLEDMEEVLETLETFERQGNADEREIESLRRALHRLQRPRDGGGHHRGHG